MNNLEKVEYALFKIIDKILIALFLLFFFGGIIFSIIILLFRFYIFLKSGIWNSKSIMDAIDSIKLFHSIKYSIHKWTGLVMILKYIPDFLFILIASPLTGYLIALINTKLNTWIKKMYID
ncbi:MAG: hypothetical protein WC679_13350 [Bacteroidales bacterium]